VVFLRLQDFFEKMLAKLGMPNYIRGGLLRQVRRYMLVKSGKLSASLEDYLEAIFNLAAGSKVARSKDIAEALGVSKSSVTGALRILKKKGLAHYKPYDYVTLTEAGQEAAGEVVRKHNILKSFLISILGVEKDIAQEAACKAEHVLGPEVIARLLRFIEFVTRSGENGFDLAGEFKRFLQDKPENQRK
jgi:DtxR family Mn-dependent transcriptional regulator